MVIGDTAFDRGTFSFDVSPKGGGESARVTGQYLWLLRRTGPEPWKIARLIVSRNDESDGAVNAPCATDGYALPADNRRRT